MDGGKYCQKVKDGKKNHFQHGNDAKQAGQTDHTAAEGEKSQWVIIQHDRDWSVL